MTNFKIMIFSVISASTHTRCRNLFVALIKPKCFDLELWKMSKKLQNFLDIRYKLPSRQFHVQS